ncbi:MAG: hypothetical protein ACPLPR_06800 [Bacillota bacterium]
MEKNLAAKILMVLLDRVEEAVVAVDCELKPIYMNSRARKILFWGSKERKSGPSVGNGNPGKRYCLRE